MKENGEDAGVDEEGELYLKGDSVIRVSIDNPAQSYLPFLILFQLQYEGSNSNW